ncbi:DUF4190 domain-containing protein [Microbacterium thalassium]|uniref:DUF4190 domain-containing protein n=1 Tax=Microbacterium thalassium TaxID=362649 RepID=A0A7X0FNR2_9MICO|nr:DUF4190 domain-containing protein [Microbacterium thalassium]MBB6390879.1 hypothetical protein [Microbacterium thalassium]
MPAPEETAVDDKVDVEHDSAAEAATGHPATTTIAAPPAPAKRNGLAVSALVVGIAAFATGWIPFLGAALGIAAVTLGIVALVRRQSKGFGITGLALGAVGLVASVLMSLTAVFLAANYDAIAAAVDEAAQTPVAVDEEPEPEPAAEPAAEDVPLSAFVELGDGAFADLVAAPDAAAGATHILFGEVQQLDEYTGACAAIIIVDESQQSSWEGYEVPAWIVAESSETDCPEFAGVGEFSHVKAWVTVLGATPTEWDDGTSDDLLTLSVRQVEILPELP